MSLPKFGFFTVHDDHKTQDLVNFARRFSARYPIVSSGGTARFLQKEGIEVTTVTQLVAHSMITRLKSGEFSDRVMASITNALREQASVESASTTLGLLRSSDEWKTSLPKNVVDVLVGEDAILGHRVVTLRPEVYGPMLATEGMLEELELLGMCQFVMVRVSYYPLHAAIKKDGATAESVFEKTDIGGPAITMAAVKGERLVVVDPADHDRALSYFGNQPNRNVLREFQVKAINAVLDYYAPLRDFLAEEVPA